MWGENNRYIRSWETACLYVYSCVVEAHRCVWPCGVKACERTEGGTIPYIKSVTISQQREVEITTTSRRTKDRTDRWMNECVAWKMDGLMDGWFKWQEKWQKLPDKWMDWQIDGRADRWIKMQEKKKEEATDLSGSGRKKSCLASEWWKQWPPNLTNAAESDLFFTHFRAQPEAGSVDSFHSKWEPASKLVLALSRRVDFRFLPLDWTGRKEGWLWWGRLAFPCFLSMESSDAEKGRSPLSLLRPVTSINAVAERRDEKANGEHSEKHTHTSHKTHTHTRGTERRGGEVWLIHLYFIIMLRGSNPHKAFVSVLLWVLTSCYLCPRCCPFVFAVVLVYCLLSLETNCLVEAVILISCTYLWWIQHTT